MQKFALVFPGQGSQHVGMGSEFFKEFRAARDTFAEASDALGIDMASLCFEGPREKLDQTLFTQTSVLTAETAAYRVFAQEAGVEPAIMAGHSLGEYGAIQAAGALDFQGALTLVEARARLQQEEVPLGQGGMAAMFDLTAGQLEEMCAAVRTDLGEKGAVFVAILNGPGQVVVAGLNPGLDEVIARAKRGGGRGIKIPVSVPFHCALMAGAARRFEEVLGNVEFGDFRVPVIPNFDPAALYSRHSARGHLVKQIVSVVRWHETVDRMAAAGIKMAIEVGPRKVQTGLIKRINREIRTANVEDVESLKKTLQELNEQARSGGA